MKLIFHTTSGGQSAGGEPGASADLEVARDTNARQKGLTRLPSAAQLEVCESDLARTRKRYPARRAAMREDGVFIVFGRSALTIDHCEATMKDLAIALDNRPGALAEMGEALGRTGVSVEGGGAFVVNGQGVAHFLFQDGVAARNALEAAGIHVLEIRDVLALRLNQTEPGQLGRISRRMAEAGVNIEVLYSDHDHQLILVVDDIAKGRAVSEAWMRE